jgi:predicted transcriptional regulator
MDIGVKVTDLRQIDTHVAGVDSNDKVYTLPVSFNRKNSTMPKEAVFTMKLEPELRNEFMAEAVAAHRPASQILRELMREFVKRQRDARAYDDFLSRKVEAGRASMRAARGKSNEEVEAEFAARRASVTRQA